MALDERIESIYLNVWKGLVLLIATIALIVAIAASGFAINGFSTAQPFRPVEIKIGDRNELVEQNLSLDSFRIAGTSGEPTGNPASPASSLDDSMAPALKNISENLAHYVRTAYPGRSPNPEIIRVNVRNILKDLKLKNDADARFYFSSLEKLSGELAKAGAEEALLPEAKRIHSGPLLRWHARTVQQLLQAVDQDNHKLKENYRQQVVDYTKSHAKILSYVAVAASSFAIFVFTVFLFVIIKIERHLNSMAVASTLTTKQLESSAR